MSESQSDMLREHFGDPKRCDRCGKEFFPLRDDQPTCVSCLRQRRADVAFQKMAFGSEWK